MPVHYLRALIDAELAEIRAIRHDLHAHPELGYQEKRTSGVVVAELSRLGIAHVGGMAGGTGVLAHLPATEAAASGAPAIAFRADLDALPIEEVSALPYSSTNRGVMHACGHDGHTANLLGVARVLAKLPARPNPVTLIFQPAEEGGAGGKRMCEEGALDGSRLGPRVGRIFGLHGWPQYAVGTVGTRPGPLLAATDNFTVRVLGEQAHAAYPQLSRDPIIAASHIVTALQTICSRNTRPQDSVVVSVTKFNAGIATNVIPAEATFGGTVRSLKPETRAAAKRRFYEIVEGLALAMGCRADIRWDEGYPVTRNEPALTERFLAMADAAYGAERVVRVPDPSLGGEDFSYYGQHVPACFFMLGMRPAGRDTYPSLHQPTYDFNDDALPIGIETMCRLALAEW